LCFSQIKTCATNDNIVNLNGTTVTGTITGGTAANGTGNTLNVKGENSAQSVEGFQKMKFHADTAASGQAMLNLTTGATTLDKNAIDADGSTTNGRVTLLRNDNGINLTGYTNGVLKSTIEGNTEKNIDVEKNAAEDKIVKVTYEGAQFADVQNAVEKDLGSGKKNAYGGISRANNATRNNKITVNGTYENVYGGYTSGTSSTAEGEKKNSHDNTVTITGGALNNNNKIYAGDSRSISSTSNGNIVNLGDENGNFSANLNRAEIWGTSYGGQVQDNNSNLIKGNTLNVNASGIRLEKVRNFEKINFNLTPTVTAGSTMLTMDTGNFGLGYGKAFDWKNFSLTGKENDTDKTKYGRIGNINLLFAYSGSDMKIGNYTTGGKKGTTGDYEYHMEADGGNFMGSRSSQLIKANVDRFKNADATADNVTGTALYGGYSSLGNTTTNNKIKITNTNNTNLSVYGGYTAGDGNATNNHVTITGTGKVGGVYAGRAQSAAGKAERNTITIEPGGWAENPIFGGYAKGGVKGNIVNIKGKVNATAYGGRLMGSGTAEANEVHLEDATVKNQVIGAEGDDGALVKENRISVAKSLVKEDVIGGFSRGTTGKAEGNTVSVTGDSARVKGTVTGAMRQGTRRPLGIRLASRKGRLKETSMEATACKTVRLRVIQQVFRAVY